MVSRRRGARANCAVRPRGACRISIFRVALRGVSPDATVADRALDRSTHSFRTCTEIAAMLICMSGMRSQLLLGQGNCPIKRGSKETDGSVDDCFVLSHRCLQIRVARFLPRVDPTTGRALLPARIGFSSARRLLLPPAGVSIPGAPRRNGHRARVPRPAPARSANRSRTPAAREMTRPASIRSHGRLTRSTCVRRVRGGIRRGSTPRRSYRRRRREDAAESRSAAP